VPADREQLDQPGPIGIGVGGEVDARHEHQDEARDGPEEGRSPSQGARGEVADARGRNELPQAADLEFPRERAESGRQALDDEFDLADDPVPIEVGRQPERRDDEQHRNEQSQLVRQTGMLRYRLGQRTQPQPDDDGPEHQQEDVGQDIKRHAEDNHAGDDQNAADEYGVAVDRRPAGREFTIGLAGLHGSRASGCAQGGEPAADAPGSPFAFALPLTLRASPV
jgi:hypothetical protein